ncbi:hypothetical protein M5689_011980 [Euphorbia peplus]|nr:hypothetical protein M5689_011980 [Euphorbia peplus]
MLLCHPRKQTTVLSENEPSSKLQKLRNRRHLLKHSNKESKNSSITIETISPLQAIPDTESLELKPIIEHSVKLCLIHETHSSDIHGKHIQ